MTKNAFLLFFLSISIAGCKSTDKEINKPEASLFYEIFPVLIDTLHTDLRLYPFEIANDTIKIDSIVKDTTSIVIAISDTLEHLKKRDYASLQNYVNASSKALDSMIEDTTRIVDLSKLNATDNRIRFKSIATFPKGLDFWKTEYNFYLSAKFYFSRILFNRDKTIGLLNVGYVCGPIQCGEGFLIYLKKVNERWVIDKIEETWAM